MFRLLLILYGLALAGATDDGCNEMVCGSVVSKCLLTQSCQCKLNNCYCCKDCLNCLGDLYTECCGCLDMCPKHKDALPALALRSEIGDVEGVPELFDTLTAEDDAEWLTIRFPMRPDLGQQLTDANQSSSTLVKNDLWHKQLASVNCTVIYMNSCIRSIKCRQQCESMGANSYRWFHDGCCECIGAHCLNYGINESRCRFMPEPQEQGKQSSLATDSEQDLENMFDMTDDDLNDDDMWDYGEVDMDI